MYIMRKFLSLICRIFAYFVAIIAAWFGLSLLSILTCIFNSVDTKQVIDMKTSFPFKKKIIIKLH